MGWEQRCEKQQLTLSKAAPRVFNFNMNLYNILLLLITTLELCILCMSEMGIHSLVLKVSALQKMFTLCWCKYTTTSVKVIFTYFSGDRIRLDTKFTFHHFAEEK